MKYILSRDQFLNESVATAKEITDFITTNNKGNLLFKLYDKFKNGKTHKSIRNIILSSDSKNAYDTYKKGNEAPIAESVINEAVVPLETPSDWNVSNIDREKLIKFAKLHVKTKKSLFIQGAPGIGKTFIVKQLAKDLDMDIIDIDTSIIEAVDFSGLPAIKTDADGNEYTTLIATDLQPTDNGPHGNGGIIFLDEINRSNPSIQNACLRLVQYGSIGKYKLPDKWVVFMAGNREFDDPGFVDKLGMALANRGSQYNFVPKVEHFLEYGSKVGIHEHILSFIKSFPDMMHKLDDSGEQKIFPSPRSQHEVSKLYKEYLDSGEKFSNDELIEYLSGGVGVEAAAQFIQFVNEVQQQFKHDLDLIFTNYKEAFYIKNPDIHQLHTFITAVSSKFEELIKEKPSNKEVYYKNVCDYIIERYINNAEQATLFLQSVTQIIAKYFKFESSDKNITQGASYKMIIKSGNTNDETVGDVIKFLSENSIKASCDVEDSELYTPTTTFIITSNSDIRDVQKLINKKYKAVTITNNKQLGDGKTSNVVGSAITTINKVLDNINDKLKELGIEPIKI